jgi:hypothetical protein
VVLAVEALLLAVPLREQMDFVVAVVAVVADQSLQLLLALVALVVMAMFASLLLNNDKKIY